MNEPEARAIWDASRDDLVVDMITAIDRSGRRHKCSPRETIAGAAFALACCIRVEPGSEEIVRDVFAIVGVSLKEPGP